MATEQNLQTLSLVEAADLSTHQFKCVKVDSSGHAALCSVAGEMAVGVLSNKPKSGLTNDCVSVVTGGAPMAMAGAAIAAGAKVATAATGKLRTAVSGDHVLGVALQAAGADGDIIKIQILRDGIVP